MEKQANTTLEPSLVPETDLQAPDKDWNTGEITYLNTQQKMVTRQVKILQVRPFGWSFIFTDNGSEKDPYVAAIYFHPKDNQPARWGILHGDCHRDPWIITDVFWQPGYQKRFGPKDRNQTVLSLF